ncbi:MAG: permease-like cell division protein FtsX [Burkholderiales bacterium]
MTAWLRQHQRAFFAAWRRMAQQPLVSIFSVVVIGIALSLPTALFVALQNFNALAGHINAEPQLSLYMAAGATPAETQQIESQLKARSDVANYRFIAREQALKEMKDSAGIADVLAALEKNPLPDAFIVRAKSSKPEFLAGMREEFLTWPKVEHVQLDSAWARKLASLNSLAQKMVSLLALILGIALVAITGNTIRLQILTQKDEIEVGKLIGATNRFIRRPYLYFGTLQGLLGGLCALGIVFFSIRWLGSNLIELLQLYESDFRIAPLSMRNGAIIAGMSALLGWLGAFVSVAMYFRKILPRS